MSRSSRLRTTRVPFASLLLLLGGLLTGPDPGFAQGTCSVGSPARAVTNLLWGSLRPGDSDLQGNPLQLPDPRDSTDYTGNNLPNSQRPLYLAVDVEGGWVFTSYASGFRIWDTASNAENPPMAGAADLRSGSGCTPSNFWPTTPLCTGSSTSSGTSMPQRGNTTSSRCRGLRPWDSRS